MGLKKIWNKLKGAYEYMDEQLGGALPGGGGLSQPTYTPPGGGPAVGTSPGGPAGWRDGQSFTQQAYGPTSFGQEFRGWMDDDKTQSPVESAFMSHGGVGMDPTAPPDPMKEAGGGFRSPDKMNWTDPRIMLAGAGFLADTYGGYKEGKEADREREEEERRRKENGRVFGEAFRGAYGGG